MTKSRRTKATKTKMKIATRRPHIRARPKWRLITQMVNATTKERESMKKKIKLVKNHLANPIRKIRNPLWFVVHDFQVVALLISANVVSPFPSPALLTLLATRLPGLNIYDKPYLFTCCRSENDLANPIKIGNLLWFVALCPIS